MEENSLGQRPLSNNVIPVLLLEEVKDSFLVLVHRHCTSRIQPGGACLVEPAWWVFFPQAPRVELILTFIRFGSPGPEHIHLLMLHAWLALGRRSASSIRVNLLFWIDRAMTPDQDDSRRCRGTKIAYTLGLCLLVLKSRIYKHVGVCLF